MELLIGTFLGAMVALAGILVGRGRPESKPNPDGAGTKEYLTQDEMLDIASWYEMAVNADGVREFPDAYGWVPYVLDTQVTVADWRVAAKLDPLLTWVVDEEWNRPVTIKENTLVATWRPISDFSWVRGVNRDNVELFWFVVAAAKNEGVLPVQATLTLDG